MRGAPDTHHGRSESLHFMTLSAHYRDAFVQLFWFVLSPMLQCNACVTALVRDVSRARYSIIATVLHSQCFALRSSSRLLYTFTKVYKEIININAMVQVYSLA